ncbi:response regulator [Cohnella sp.]|uniref:response regulator transcription factor n=1 Tax=Cohnella sp. TaxID=1883426 RepID=UPI003704BFF6
MYKILIVDDERIIADGLADMLAESGLPLAAIRTAGSAAEALERHGEEKFDIVLTDIRMPRMDGLELFDRIRAVSEECRVIFLSGYSEFEYARTALKLGASDYLLKPVEDEEVVACLSKTIGAMERERSRLSEHGRTARELSESLPYAQGELFRNLLHSLPEMAESALDDQFRELRVPFRSSAPVTSFAMSLDDMERALSFMDEALLQFMLQNMVGELLGDVCEFVCFAAGSGVFVVALQRKSAAAGRQGFEQQDFEQQGFEGAGFEQMGFEGSAETFEVLRRRLGEVQEIVGRAFKLVCSFALLSEWVAWPEWPQAIGRLIGGLKLRIGTGQIIVHSSRETAGRSPSAPAFSSDLLQPVTEAINLKDVPGFAASLDLLLERIEREQRSDGELAAWFLAISGRIVGVAQQHRATAAIGPEEMSRMSNLHMHSNLAQLRSFLVRVLQAVVDEIGRQQRNPTELLVEQVKQYIVTHLYESLSLELLADKAHVNPSYLSRIFRQYTGEQLTAYVTRMKMEQAGKLLAGGAIRVQDVAARLGFDNPNYFAKVFRKATGLSPHEYRQHHSGI